MRCKQCKTKFEKEDVICQGTYYFCSKKCRQEFNREKIRKEKEKVKLKKTKKKEKKANSISILTDKADKLWAEAVKINYNYKCQYTDKGIDEVQLHSHHLFTRSRKSTRWDIDNGICLSAGSHIFSAEFSAHKTPLEFAERLQGLRGRDWINKLSKKSREVVKVTPEFIKEKIDNLNKFINDYKNN